MYSKDKGLDFSRVMFICSVGVRSITLLLKVLIMQSGCANKHIFGEGGDRRALNNDRKGPGLYNLFSTLGCTYHPHASKH